MVATKPDIRCPGCRRRPCQRTEDCPGGRHFERMLKNGTLLTVHPEWQRVLEQVQDEESSEG